MKMTKYLSVALALIVLASCSTDDNPTSSWQNNPLAVKVQVAIDQSSQTRSNPTNDAISGQFNVGDAVSISASSANLGTQTAVYTKSTNEWTPSQPAQYLLWDGDKSMTFRAHYPAEKENEGVFTVPTDQSDADKLIEADYMTCNTQQQKGNLVLNMKRQMARIKITGITYRQEFEGKHPTLQALRIYSLNQIGGSQPVFTEINPCKEQGDTYIALVAPTAEQADQHFMKLTIAFNGNESKEMYVKGMPALEAGKSYSFNISAGKEVVQLENVSITDWIGSTDSHIQTGSIPPTIDKEKNAIYVWESGTITKQMIIEASNGTGRLVVEGNINGTDIRWIRQACGCKYYSNDTEEVITTALDLGNAHIVGGGEAYKDEEGTYFFRTVTNTIGEDMFRDSELTSIVLPKDLTCIGEDAFKSNNITEVTIPDGVTTINNQAFYWCHYLRTVHFSQKGNLKEIDDQAFEDCDDLEQLIIPEGVTTIGDNIVIDCNNITTLSFPSTVTSIGTQRLKKSVKDLFFHPRKENIELEQIFHHPNPSSCHLRLHQSWAADVTNANEWQGNTWKQITFLDDQGKPLAQ